MASHHRVAIAGAGFGGIAAAIRLKEAGIDDYVVIERSDDIGGTWHVNTYPGCACDVPSHMYSLSFAPNPTWSRAFAPQPEIEAYLQRVADEHGIRERVRLNTTVERAEWDDEACRWRLETSGGPISADIVISAMGGLSAPALPAIPGIESFEGKLFHSAEWDHDHDLTGERVAVIGTGASSIQFVPRIQPQVGQLHVFQRTPPWIMPRMDRPYLGIERAAWRAFPPLQKAVRLLQYWSREALVLGLAGDTRLLKGMRLIGLAHMRRQVPDKRLRRKLTPSYDVGCKRILISNDYLPALTKPNVELVTDGIREIRGNVVVTADGTEREVDTIIAGTGFHVTDNPVATRITGQDGRTLADIWNGAPQVYRGTTIAGFPNAFMLLGPNTGLGHNSVIFMIEAQLNYVIDAIRTMDERGLASVAPRPEVQAAHNERLQESMKGTVWTAGGCASWYIDSAGRNSTLWPTYSFRYAQKMRRFDLDAYEVRERVGAPAAEPTTVPA